MMPNPTQYPSDWAQKKFEDFATLQRGKDLPVQSREEGIFPILGSNGVCGYHNDFVSEGPGVVTGRSGSVGGSYYVDGKFWPLNTALWVKNFHGNFPLFVHYFFQSFDFARFKGGVSVPTLNRNLFSNELVTIPPLPEQRSIAEVLAKIQEAITAQQDIIDRTRELKKSLMAKLFTEGLRGEPTKETEIGPVPESWEVAKIIDYCEKPQYGFTESSTSEPVGPRFLRITDITENGVNWDNVPYCQCPKNKIASYQLVEGDIVFARIGATTGKSYIINNPPQSAVFASYLIRVRAKKGLIPAYLYHFFNSNAYWHQVDANKGNNLKLGINGSILANMLLPVAPLPVQTQISILLDKLDEKIAAATELKGNATDLFKTMLHELMTGNIRTTPLMEA